MPLHARTESEHLANYRTGDICSLPDSQANATSASISADWRLATFSVVLPLPESALGKAHARRKFIDLDCQWKRTRYEGFSRLEIARGGSTTASGDTVLSLDPHLSTAENRFGPLIGRTVTGSREEVAAGTPEARRLGAVRLAHRVLDAADASTSFRIKETGGTGSARILLRSVELLQYLEPDADPRNERFDRYAVLHIVVEDCTDVTLERVAQSMNRPRNFLEVLRDENTPVFEGKYPNSLRPLSYFTALAITLLERGSTEEAFDVELSQGGYLCRRKKSDQPKLLPTDHRLSPPPKRVVLAVPGGQIAAAPSLLRRETATYWSLAEKWAWVLSTGADKYFESFPAETSVQAERARCEDHRSWTIWASEGGLALVRHDLESQAGQQSLGEPAYLQLAQTRYVDLLVLTLRAFEMLSTFSAALASIDREIADDLAAFGNSVRVATAEAPAGEGAQLERLRHQLEKLERIQSDFVVFRDKLWFRSIPRHPVDTEILRRLPEMCGVSTLYSEFVDELSLRRDVYSTQHSASELEVARALEAQREADRSTQERDRVLQEQLRDKDRLARESARTAQQDRGERLNQILAVAAVAFAVPAIVESFGLWDSLLAGFITLALIFLLAYIGNQLVKRLAGRRAHESASSTKPDSSVVER